MKCMLKLLPLLFFSLLFGTINATASENVLDAQTSEILHKIKTVEASLKTFEASFEQIQKSALFKDIVRSEGITRYDARGKLLFQVTDPSPYRVVFDGEWVYIHDPVQSQTKKHRIGNQENILKKYFGVGQSMDELTGRFDIKAFDNAPLPGVTLEMKPKKGSLAKRVQLISAIVDETTWLPKEIFIQQAQGDWTRLHLTFISMNQPLGDDAFDVDGGNPKNNAAGEPDTK